jgi:DNA (cytosine-5)-methyltransferase 1
MITCGSLFTGIGGIDLAFATAGFSIVFQVEIDPFCRQVLTKHALTYWPNAKLFADVHDVGRHNLPAIDILFGGFPCQDVSNAGKRAGISEGTRSGLWFEFARIIGELRPRIVLVENVPGILTRDGTIVIADLAKMGYVGHWGIISASDAGAPHKRERVFIVAYRDRDRQTSPDGGQWGIVSDDNGDGTAEKQRRRIIQYGAKRGGQTLGNPNGQYANRRRLNTGSLSQYKTPSVWRCKHRYSESRLGRDAHGVSYRLDSHRFPAPPGKPYTWEPTRTTEVKTDRAARLQALGNAVVPQCVYPVALAIMEWMEGETG